jgi:hypothetical protein
MWRLYCLYGFGVQRRAKARASLPHFDDPSGLS